MSSARSEGDGDAGDLLPAFEQVHLGGDRDVADADRRHIRRIAGQRLGDQAGRVGKVDEQRAGGQLGHVLRNAEDDGNGAQRLGHAADAGRLLADEAIAAAEVLVLAARFHPAHAQLRGDVGGALDGGAAVGGEDDLKGGALGLHHALGKAAHYVQPFLQDVEQP